MAITPAEAHTLSWKRGHLPVWVVYDHPNDYPEGFVARMHVVIPSEGPTMMKVEADTLKGVREQLPPGLTRIPRDPNDDPKIVECWI